MIPERREYFKKRYQAKRTEILAYQMAYQKANPDVVKRAQSNYRLRHQEKIKASRAVYLAKNKEKSSASHRAWIAANRQRRTAQLRAWREANRPALREYDRLYCAQHREDRAATENRRRARKMGNGGNHTYAEWEMLKASCGWCCAYCGCRPNRLSKDHKIPLARGGSDDIANIAPACLPCNRRKHAKTADEFKQEFGK